MTHRGLLVLALGVFMAALGIVLSLRTITVYGDWHPVNWETWAFVGWWYVVFLAGAALPIERRPRVSSVTPDVWVIILSTIAALGAAIMTYEFAIVRGYGFSIPVNDLRIMQVEHAAAGFVGSWLGGIGRLLISALIVAWLVACMNWHRMRWRSILALLIASAVVVAYQTKFEGGRLFVASLALASGFGSILFIASDVSDGTFIRLRRISFRHLAPLALVSAMMVGTFAYSSYTFSSRGADTVKQIDAVIEHERRTEKPPAAIVQQAVQTEVSQYAILYLRYASDFMIDLSTLTNATWFDSDDYPFAMAWIYLSQGFSEFDRIFQLEELNYSLGFYQFPQLAQVFSKALNVDVRYNLKENLPNSGTYLTLPGASYLDFGYAPGLAFALILGVGFRFGFVSALQSPGSTTALVAPLIFVIVAVGPVTTLLPNLWPCFVWILGMAAVERAWSGIIIRRRAAI